MRGWIKGGFWGAVVITLLWSLNPRAAVEKTLEPGTVEIQFMGNAGPVQGALEDAIREFERLSRERHAIDPDYPIYRVVSGQNASRNQTEDPTRFLVSLAGGMPPDVIFFDRFAISEWAARGAFTPPALQAVKRDFAFLVAADMPADALLRAVRGADKAAITDVRLFDRFTGPGVPEGQISMALTVTLQPGAASFTDAEIDAISASVIAAAGKAVGATLRG